MFEAAKGVPGELGRRAARGDVPAVGAELGLVAPGASSGVEGLEALGVAEKNFVATDEEPLACIWVSAEKSASEGEILPCHNLGDSANAHVTSGLVVLVTENHLPCCERSLLEVTFEDAELDWGAQRLGRGGRCEGMEGGNTTRMLDGFWSQRALGVGKRRGP